MDRTEKTSALPDLSRQATGANDPLKEELQTSSLANAPAMDRSEQLVLENPELATFREGDTWVIDEPRLSSFLAKAQVSLSAEGNPPTADTLPLFDEYRTYTPAKPQTFTKQPVEDLGYLDSEDDLIPCIGLEVLRKLGAHELADHAEGLLDDSVDEDFDKTVDLETDFLQQYSIRRFGIKPPDGVTIDRASVGPQLLHSAKRALDEEWRAGRDKVSQRRLASELDIEGLHQPRFVDVRELTSRQPLAVFQQIDISALPVDFITQAPPGEKRILVFEDATQGFLIVNDSTGIFLHSDNVRIAAIISSGDLDERDLPREMFPEAYANFCKEMSGEKGAPVYLFERNLIGATDRDEFLDAAHALVNHGSDTFIKSTRTSGGELIVNLKFDADGQPGIRSNSPEIGHSLLSLLTARENLEVFRKIASSARSDTDLTRLAAVKLQELCTMPGFLKHLMSFMEAPIIEETIPVMRLEKENEKLKIEFRIILQGDDKLSITGHYAKASPNEVAANISLGGGGLKTFEAIEGLHRQKLSNLFSEADILQKSREAYDTIMSLTLEFGDKYASELRQKGLAGSRDMRDFAVDICPVWDEQSNSMTFYLLEVQYGYGYTGLEHADPEMAATVTAFKDKLAERLAEQARKIAEKKLASAFAIKMLGSFD